MNEVTLGGGKVRWKTWDCGGRCSGCRFENTQKKEGGEWRWEEGTDRRGKKTNCFGVSVGLAAGHHGVWLPYVDVVACFFVCLVFRCRQRKEDDEERRHE